MVITLKEHRNLNEIIGSLSEPKTLDEIIDFKNTKVSLEDSGISNFKEIKNLSNISFGHFIILEKILTNESLDYEDKIEMIAPIMLRPLNEVQLSNDNKEEELKHKENVFNEPLGNIAGAFKRLLNIRATYLYKTYNGVIYATQDDDEDKEEDKEEGTNINSSMSARAFHSKKFFWQTMISDVANGNIFDFDKVVELMMYTVMPYLAEKRSLEIVEYLEHKASMI